MSKYINKTQPTADSVVDFINSYPNPKITLDCLSLLELFSKVSGFEPVLWSTKIGFGKYHYKQKSSEGAWFITGFTPTKAGITIYSMGGYDSVQELLPKLGKHTVKGSCLHLKTLDGIDLEILAKVVESGVKYMKDKYSTF